MTYLIKQIVAAAVTPLACALLFAIAGGIARLIGRYRISTLLWSFGAFVVYFSAISPVANILLAPLENQYAPLGNVQDLPQVRFIVVLGSGYWPHDGVPVTAALPGNGLARIAEGVRLMRLVHGARLVVSGGAPENRPATAIGYADFAIDLGVDPDAIVKLDKSLDTAEEAAAVAGLVGASPFLLVTSAYHMPRAVRLMHLAGAHPIAAPTGQLTSRQISFGVRSWIPSSGSLRKTECALHEYMGLAIVH
jgi:uncharacterized SAM-binding protein YcdF (DUF218 family)